MSETLEQIAVRLAQWIIWAQGGTPTPDEERIRIRVAKLKILAALREVEARGEQRAATLGGALLDSAIERAEKAERLVSLAEKEAIAFRDQMHEERIRAEKAEAELMSALLDSRHRGALQGQRAEKTETENARLREALTAAQVRANELASDLHDIVIKAALEV